MDDKRDAKSRIEKRKESRAAKSNRKLLAWTQHQKTKKPKKKMTEPKLNNVKTKHKVRLKGNSKTKFEEYLQMDNEIGVASMEEDLKLEKRLAKKLKVKDGLLPGLDDNINSLFVDSDSDFDSQEEEIQVSEETSEEVFVKLSSSKQGKKRKSSRGRLGSGKKPRKGSVVDEGQEHDIIDSTTNSLELVDEVESTAELEVSTLMESKAGLEVSSLTETSNEEKPSKELTKVPVVAAYPKYVPPRLRSHAEDDLEYLKNRRHVRGLLNRLSEANVETTTGELCSLFNSIGRGLGSQIISEEILASCSGGPRGNEQYAAVFAACVAGMASMVGIDFSAKVIAALAKSFEDEYQKEDNLSLRNLTLLLAYLCIFGVCSSDLIYDFLIMLSKRLTEVDVSIILTILQCCGMKLRGDDPSAMKNFILSVQNRVHELKSLGDGHKNMNNRMEFMLETICDIKNNKKRAKEETGLHTRIKKWLKKLGKEDILIRGVTWSKLLDPNKKGQWWWSGDMSAATNNVHDIASTIDKEVSEVDKMLKLAAAQRMNTNTRKAIFCIIMTGEDYVDAFEKLLRLDLPGKQDREIMRVLLECCLQEKVFNKYYTILASKLCGYDKKHKFTLQYCLWDHFKELDSMQLLRLMHLSRFIAEMLASFSLSLSVLKAVELSDTTQLTAKRIMHFKLLFQALFEYSDKLIWNIFTRIAVTPELEILRASIEFFINQYVVSTNKAVAEKFKVAKKALNNVEGVLI